MLAHWRRMLAGFVGLTAALLLALFVASTGFPAALRPSPARPVAVLIDDVRLISMRPGRPEAEEHRAVLVVDGRIAGVGPAASLDAPEAALRVDGRGRTLLPGLVDAHVHLWDEAELAAYLAHGVTSVRNMSGMPFHLTLARRIEEGRILGPDLLTTGPILNSAGPNAQDNHVLVEDAEAARAAVRAQAEAGYRTLKVYSNLKREPYEAVLDEARRLGLAVAGHTPEGVRAAGVPHQAPFDVAFEEVLDDGFVTLEHTESIVWHGLSDRLDAAAMVELAQRIAEAGAVVTPTLIAHDNLVRVAETRGAYLQRPGTDTLNPLLGRFQAGVYAYWSSADPEAREAPRRTFYRQATRILHEAGVVLIAGSDAGIFTNLPGSALIRELELLVAAGLTPHEALATATRAGAEALGLDGRGVVRPGAVANLVLVDADPLANVSVLEHPDAVMVRGVWLDEAELADLREAARDTSELRTARRLILGLLGS